MITTFSKKENRLYAKEVRNTLASSGILQNKSSSIVSKILNSAIFQNAHEVALYLPIKNEVDISSLMKVVGKNFYLPRCVENELEFVKFENFHNIKNGDFGTKEPLGNAVNPEILDVIYIPALMANKRNYRLGYGKGYYDRFFAKYNLKAKKIIVVVQELINSNFEEDEFDYQCDEIISA